MKFNILTIFPNSFSYFNESIIKKAIDKKIIDIEITDIREFSKDKHKTVDDKPYGGGPGMLMKFQPIYDALEYVKKKNKKFKKTKVILFSPTGKKFDQKLAKKYSKLNNIIMISGHYEGVDKRIEKFVDEKISIGDFVLTNGNIPAMIIVDCVSRLLPNVLGNEESFKNDSFYNGNSLEYDQYTKPEVIEVNGKKLKVPKVLLSGNHKIIETWRNKKTKIIK